MSDYADLLARFDGDATAVDAYLEGSVPYVQPSVNIQHRMLGPAPAPAPVVVPRAPSLAPAPVRIPRVIVPAPAPVVVPRAPSLAPAPVRIPRVIVPVPVRVGGDFVEPGTDEYADHVRAGALPVAPAPVRIPRVIVPVPVRVGGDFVEPGTDEYADHVRAGALPVVQPPVNIQHRMLGPAPVPAPAAGFLSRIKPIHIGIAGLVIALWRR